MQFLLRNQELMQIHEKQVPTYRGYDAYTVGYISSDDVNPIRISGLS